MGRLFSLVVFRFISASRLAESLPAIVCGELVAHMRIAKILIKI